MKGLVVVASCFDYSIYWLASRKFRTGHRCRDDRASSSKGKENGREEHNSKEIRRRYLIFLKGDLRRDWKAD